MTRDTDYFSSRKQGKVSFVLERSGGFVISSARKVLCHPCNPFHGVSIAICATLSSSSILHSPLYFVYCVPALAVGTRHTRLHGYPWHVLPQLRLV